MPFRSLAVLGIAVFVCGTSGGCVYEFRARINCPNCTAFTSWTCSEDDATKQAEAFINSNKECELDDVENQLVSESDCRNGLAIPLPGAVNKVIRDARLFTSLEREVLEADVPTCSTGVDVKVTVLQDVPVPDCPGDIEVEVSYFKEIIPGNLEYLTLSATVPVNGSHEFTCIGAQVNPDTGKVGTIRVAVLTDLNCLGNPDLATASSYSQIPADGSSLKVRADLEAITLNSEIIPPQKRQSRRPGDGS